MLSGSGARNHSFTFAPTVAALVAAIAAFILFRSTLLPGLDFGDTASLQVVVGSPIISTRDGYPLFFALAALVFRLAGGDPAHALNLTSALESAAACGVLSLVAAELAGSALAGMAAALLFAASYTLWSQAVIGEVYGLHLLCVTLTMWLLLWWEKRPALARLVLFFAVYALAFGNHLSMILLTPAYAAFILMSAPGGWRSMFRPRVILLATFCAAAGALQYAWNLRTLWYAVYPPHGLVDAIGAAWFDITKADWRETMVMNVPRELLGNHARMYLFDLRQQFGWPAVVLSIAGATLLVTSHPRRAVLVVGVFVANLLFAYSYNVGDTHVFFLPSHMMIALLTAPAVALLARKTSSVRRLAPLFSSALIVYAAARMYHDYPALDRSSDRRPIELLDRLTVGIDDRQAVLLTDLNWQVQNGLTYYGQRLHPDVVSRRLADVLLYAPALVHDNHDIGREVVLTARANSALAAAYGPLIPTVRDSRVAAPTIADLTRDTPPGTRYVLCVLKPTREFTLDNDDLTRAVVRLSGGTLTSLPHGEYAAIGGIVGRAPVVVAGADTPFRRRFDLDGTPVQVRMDSWLAADTIRRMGFGHVIADRRHTLIVERGASFVAFDQDGGAISSGYASNLFAAQPRYVCYR